MANKIIKVFNKIMDYAVVFCFIAIVIVMLSLFISTLDKHEKQISTPLLTPCLCPKGYIHTENVAYGKKCTRVTPISFSPKEIIVNCK